MGGLESLELGLQLPHVVGLAVDFGLKLVCPADLLLGLVVLVPEVLQLGVEAGDGPLHFLHVVPVLLPLDHQDVPVDVRGRAAFGAFLLAGAIPLIPFLIDTESAFSVSVTLTMATFCLIGALKSVWSLTPWWRSAAETLAIGGGAAAIAYFVGTLFHV